MNDPAIRVLRIVEGTSVDGPGLRTSVYMAGCRHRCPGCHNPQSWDFDGGTPMTAAEIADIIEYNGYGITLTGGDPFYSPGAALSIVAEGRRRLPGLNVWAYSGFTFEQLLAATDRRTLLEAVDVLVDGPFIQAQFKRGLRFRGSENQRIINVPASLAAGHPVPWTENTY